MEKLTFNWKVKEKPEDFIVKEVAEFSLDEKGKHYLYLLIKRNLNTRDIAVRYGLSYAGLKDKNAITFQYASSGNFLGDTVFEKKADGSFFGLVFLGRINKKIRIGHLKGNRFSIRLKGHRLKKQDWLINYYDLQRTGRNVLKGKKLMKELSTGVSWKSLSWLQNFYIDAYLSHLWNRAVSLMLQESFKGYRLIEEGRSYFIPDTDYDTLMGSFVRFFPLLGYKVKLSERERAVYSQVAEVEGFTVEQLLERLKSLKIKGSYRKTFVKAEDCRVEGDRIGFFL
ncbi:MAG: tRNA pseudouridine(13) synthase TruD, partial [Aquificae bacterium]|nr:tRNA pseudouridine(13) synthase TruD [Aquificota bacterium]